MTKEKDKSNDGKLLPGRSSLSRAAHELLSGEALAGMDSDPAEVAGISKMMDDFVRGIAADRERRSAIYHEWSPRHIPNVTLDQGVWLLLGFDPLRLNGPTTWSRSVRRRRFREMLNRLECQIAEGELQPIGAYIEGFSRRFLLASIASAALNAEFSTDTAQEILAHCGAGGAERVDDSADESSLPAVNFDRKLVKKRRDAHRAFVTALGVMAQDIEPKVNYTPRHKDPGAPVNKYIDVTAADYDAGFKDYCSQHLPELSIVGFTAQMLKDDRRDLNISTKRGRPPNDPSGGRVSGESESLTLGK